MEDAPRVSRARTSPLAVVLIACGLGLSGVGLYVVQLHNYLLFHALAEIFSVAIAWGIFIVARNGRRYLKDGYLTVLGVAYLFVGLLDLLHTLGFHGMGVFADYDYYGNQLWIAARYLESASLLVATAFLGRSRIPNDLVLFAVYGAITAAFIYSIFLSDIFPACYLEGVGQTRFKIASEYAIGGVLLAALVATIRKRVELGPRMLSLIVASIVATIIAELAFTLYVSNTEISNMIGHYAKVVSFYLLYRAVIHTSIAEPYASIFNALTERTRELHEQNAVNKDIFSIISHDLRTPFATLRSFGSLMQEKWREFGEREIDEILADLNRTVDRAHTLTENLLLWSRTAVDGVSVEPQELNVRALLEESSQALEATATKKDIRLTVACDADLNVTGDARTLSIALRNLISNAIKYSYPGGTVDLEGRRLNGTVGISVRDDGVGMDPTITSSSRARTKSTMGTGGEPGTGLGLSLVRRFVEANDGTVELKSAPEAGTTATITLPATG